MSSNLLGFLLYGYIKDKFCHENLSYCYLILTVNKLNDFSKKKRKFLRNVRISLNFVVDQFQSIEFLSIFYPNFDLKMLSICR
jgi:hypothetical protein